MSAAPRMLSLMTLFSLSMASCDLGEELPHAREHHGKCHADDRQDRQHDKPELPVDREQQHAGADDQEDGRHEGRNGLRDEHLDGVDVRGQVRQQHGRSDALNVGVILDRQLRHQLRPQVLRDPLRGVGLGHVLQVREEEDAKRDEEELQAEGGENRPLWRVAIDRAADEPRDHQVQAVAENRQGDERRDNRRVGPQQAE